MSKRGENDERASIAEKDGRVSFQHLMRDDAKENSGGGGGRPSLRNSDKNSVEK